MHKISLIKRIGNWLRGVPANGIYDDFEFCETDSTLLDPSVGTAVKNDIETQDNLPARSKNDQLVAMEESFNRLVDVLESLNDNVVQQREQNTQVLTRIGETTTLLEKLPDNIEANSQAVKNLAEHIKNQSDKNQKMIDIVQTLPELNREQATQLGRIVQQMEQAVDVDQKMAESMSNFDESIQGVLSNTQQQTMSLANMGQILERSELQMSDLMSRQNKRFTWLLGIILGVSTAAIVIMAVVLMIGK